MAKTPDSVQFTVGVRGPSGEWEEIGTVDVAVVVRRGGATPPLLDVPESAVSDPPAKRCPDCGRLLRGLVHLHCPERTP